MEDDADLRAYLREHLDPDYAVLEAADGDAGWRLVQPEIPDVVAPDIVMPGLDGYALCRAIKSDPETDFIAIMPLPRRLPRRADLRASPAGSTITPPTFDLRLELPGRCRQIARTSKRPMELPFPTPTAGLESAVALLRLGHPDLASKLLHRLESFLKQNSLYWQMVFEATLTQREDPTLLLHAARQAYVLEPTNQMFRANYASALLINREAPAEASKLTGEVRLRCGWWRDRSRRWPSCWLSWGWSCRAALRSWEM